VSGSVFSGVFFTGGNVSCSAAPIISGDAVPGRLKDREGSVPSNLLYAACRMTAHAQVRITDL
jgi:hypothetical protein